MNSNSKTRTNKRPQSSKIKNNNVLKDSKIFPSNIKQESAIFVEKDFTSPNVPPSNYPSIERNNRSKSALNESNDYKSESLNEEYSIIQRIWDDFGVMYYI